MTGGEMGAEILAAVARAKLSLQPGSQGGRRGLQGGGRGGLQGGGRGLQGSEEAELSEIAEDSGGPEPSNPNPHPKPNPNPDPSPNPNPDPDPSPDLTLTLTLTRHH